MSKAFFTKLLPQLDGTAAGSLTSVCGLQNWVCLHRCHPTIASALMQCGWEHHSVRHQQRFTALTGELCTMADEAAGDAEAAKRVVSMFGHGSIGDSGGCYILSSAPGALAPLLDHIATQPGHLLHGLSDTTLQRLTRNESNTSRDEHPVLLRVSQRVAALAQQHACADQARTRAFRPEVQERVLAERKINAEAGYAQHLAAITAAVSSLPAPQKAAMLTEPTTFSQLPDGVRTALDKMVRRLPSR